jgi:FMN phosphatase YigB (HAD superfamily)
LRHHTGRKPRFNIPAFVGLRSIRAKLTAHLLEGPSTGYNLDGLFGEPTRMTKLPTLFLFDVDNTLLDNDAVQDDLRDYMQREFGAAACDLYWKLFEELRTELGYADYLGALQRYRLQNMHDPRVLRISGFLIDYPFARRLYPGALDVLARFSQEQSSVILSDGDVVFQPHKVDRSGLWWAVDGRVLIYIHKEQELDDVERRYPAGHYVMVDDKLRILNAIKQVWGDRVTTVFPRQGHYAHDPQTTAKYPPADVTIDAISDLLDFDLARLTPHAR